MTTSSQVIRCYFTKTVISYLFFEYVFQHVSVQVLQSFPATKNFTSQQKLDFRSRVTSNIHALLMTASSMYALLSEGNANENKLWGDSPLIRSTLAISIGYFLSDLMYILKDVKNSGGWGYVCHHVCAIWPYAVVVHLGCLQFYANFRLLAEASTPFVNARWYYDITGQKCGKKYLYNGVILAFTFFITRIATIPYYYQLVYIASFSPEFDRLTLWVQISWILPCIILDVLNVIWCWKIFKGARKVLLQQQNARKHDPRAIGKSSALPQEVSDNKVKEE